MHYMNRRFLAIGDRWRDFPIFGMFSFFIALISVFLSIFVALKRNLSLSTREGRGSAKIDRLSLSLCPLGNL